MTNIHVRRLAVTRGIGYGNDTARLLRNALNDAVREGHKIISVVPGFTSVMRTDTTIEYLVISEKEE